MVLISCLSACGKNSGYLYTTSSCQAFGAFTDVANLGHLDQPTSAYASLRAQSLQKLAKHLGVEIDTSREDESTFDQCSTIVSIQKQYNQKNKDQISEHEIYEFALSSFMEQLDIHSSYIQKSMFKNLTILWIEWRLTQGLCIGIKMIFSMRPIT
ncbi:MAG: hypothetical protein R3A11_02490 [Bdellovibrionota bacterium]